MIRLRLPLASSASQRRFGQTTLPLRLAHPFRKMAQMRRFSQN
jgi:hypothetical protein